MAVALDPNVITTGYNLSKINENFERIDEALQDALSRSGTTPNQMTADLDMNGNQILNAGIIDVSGLTLDGNPIAIEEILGYIPPNDTVGADQIIDGSITNVHVNAAAAIAATKLAFLQAGTGAVTRTVQAKERDIVSLKDFLPTNFVDGDDATAALEAAVDYINANGKDLYIPAGEYKYTTNDYLTITGGSVWGERTTSIIFRNDGYNKFFQVGDPALAQFSCINLWVHDLTLRNDDPVTGYVANDTNPTFRFDNAYVSGAYNLDIPYHTGWIWIGQSSLCATLDFHHIRAPQMLCNLDNAVLYNCAGVFFNRVESFVAGAEWTSGPPNVNLTAGYACAVRPSSGQIIDTINWTNCQQLYFYGGIGLLTTGTGYIVNVWNDSIWDSLTGGHDFVDTTSGLIANVSFGAKAWVNCYTGYGLRTVLSNSSSKTFTFSGSRFYGAGAQCVYFTGTAGVDRDAHFEGCNLSNANNTNGGHTALYIGADGVYVNGGSVGKAGSGFNTLPDYAVSVHADATYYGVTNCNLGGSSGDYEGMTSHTVASRNRRVSGNFGSNTTFGVIASVSLSDNVLYSNKTPWKQVIQVIGGTVVGIYINEVALTGVSSGQFTLEPGWSIRVDWSSAPTFLGWYM